MGGIDARMVDKLEITPDLSVASQAPLNVPMIMQEQTQWCWAACTQMVTQYYDDDLATQCDFVNWNFGQTTCCSNGRSSACNRPLPRARVVAVFGHWGINSTWSATPMATFIQLQQQISVGAPLRISWSWTGGGGHAVMIIGTTVNAGVASVYVNDPWNGASLMTYTELTTARGLGQWAATWLDIVKM